MERGVVVDGLWQGYRPKSARGWRRRGVNWALSDVSFECSPGELLAIIGPNGSGKTTLLQTIAGVLDPMRGRVEVRGQARSLVDATGFHLELTGKENINIVADIVGVDRATLRKRYDEMVAFAGLPPEVMLSPMRTYSAGMALRLGVALVVFTDPDVLLFDEVLAVGDEAFQVQLLDKLVELRESGTTILLISHRLEQVATHADRALLLEEGRINFIGSTSEGLERYRASWGATPADPMATTTRAWQVLGQQRRRRAQ